MNPSEFDPCFPMPFVQKDGEDSYVTVLLASALYVCGFKEFANEIHERRSIEGYVWKDFVGYINKICKGFQLRVEKI